MSPAPAAALSARSAPATPAIIILGADALLAVRPATPAQLTNACYAAGYSAVIPASWGDELVAAGCLNEIAARGQDSVVLCSCPRVAERLRRVGNLVPHLLPMASPPVLAARYLRARAGATGVHITYVGECPGASDPAIDRHATPNALLRSLTKRGIVPADQSSDVDERLTRDARRFYSLPGGAPAPNWLYAEKRGYMLIEPSARDFLAEVAFRISEKERRVIDLAPRLGCACSGAVVGEPWTDARDAVAAMEPPRAVHEVLDHDVPLELGIPLEPWAGSAAEGEPTLALPLAELAALHDPKAKAPAVRLSPPPRVSRPSRPAVRPVGDPLSGASRTPAASSTVTAPGVTAPGVNRQRPPFDRPRPPEPRTAPSADPRTSPRQRSATPPPMAVPMSMLPPVPPMPAHMAALASARWTPPKSATPAASAPPPAEPIAPASVAAVPVASASVAPASAAPIAVIPAAVAPAEVTPGSVAAPVVAPPAASEESSASLAPVASIASAATAAFATPVSPVPDASVVPVQSDSSPSVAPTSAAGASAEAPRRDRRAKGRADRRAARRAASLAEASAESHPESHPESPAELRADAAADGSAEVADAPVALPQPSRSPFAPPLPGQGVPVASPRVSAALAPHLDLLPSEPAVVAAVAMSVEANQLRANAESASAASALNVEPRNSTAMREPPTRPRLHRTRTRLYTMAVACGVIAVAAASIVIFRVVTTASAPTNAPRRESNTNPAPSPATSTAETPTTAAPAAASTIDSLAASATNLPPDTVAMPGASATPRLPIGPAATPASYAGTRAGLARAGDTALVTHPLRANPAAVYSPGAAPIPRTEAAIAASRPKPPKTAAELRASAAFSDALTPEAAAEMAAVRRAVSLRRHRADSLKHVADSTGSR